MAHSFNCRPDILVVNYDNDVLANLTSCLRGAGFHVIDTGSYFEARRMLSIELPRLLIADVRLGAFNGLNLAWHRELTFPGPTIITDLIADPVLKAEASKLKAPYVTPAEPQAILSMTFVLLGAPAFAVRTAPAVFAEPNHLLQAAKGR